VIGEHAAVDDAVADDEDAQLRGIGPPRRDRTASHAEGIRDGALSEAHDLLIRPELVLNRRVAVEKDGISQPKTHAKDNLRGRDEEACGDHRNPEPPAGFPGESVKRVPPRLGTWRLLQ
jgi:hypothetical protein